MAIAWRRSRPHGCFYEDRNYRQAQELLGSYSGVIHSDKRAAHVQSNGPSKLPVGYLKEASRGPGRPKVVSRDLYASLQDDDDPLEKLSAFLDENVTEKPSYD